jgi:hypothetical protein
MRASIFIEFNQAFAYPTADTFFVLLRPAGGIGLPSQGAFPRSESQRRMVSLLALVTGYFSGHGVGLYSSRFNGLARETANGF